MKEKKIRLSTILDAKEFVIAAMQCNCKVDLCCGRYAVDGKSILGVMSLDLNRELSVRIHGEDEEFERFCDRMAEKTAECMV